MGYEELLREIQRSYTEILRSNLVGIYVHGSIAFQCFVWQGSDIDYIAVVEKELTDCDKLGIMADTVALDKRAPEKGLEMSVVRREVCANFVYPTPYELHFSRTHLPLYRRSPAEYCERMTGADPDLAAHFTVIRHRGICLCGEEIDGVFGPVEQAFFLHSIRLDVAHARQDMAHAPTYVVLNLCRTLAYVSCGLVLSKLEGGRWALENLPRELCGIVKEAVDSYAGGGRFFPDPESAAAFCDHMLKNVMEEPAQRRNSALGGPAAFPSPFKIHIKEERT